VGRQDRRARGGIAARQITGLTIRSRIAIVLLLFAITAAAIGIHRFDPEFWPPLAVTFLHSLHGTGFALLALVVYSAMQWFFPGSRNYLPAAIITMGIGVISEAAQIPGPRDAQFSDLLIDGLGIFGALGLIAAFDRSVRREISRAMGLALPTLAAAAFTIACGPSVWYSYALFEQRRAFPRIATFEHLWERAAVGQTIDARPVRILTPEVWPVKGKYVAKATENGRWGISKT